MAKDGMVAEERGKERETEGGNEAKHTRCSLPYINLRLFFFVGD